jgi:alpha-glucosidase
MLLLTLRGTPTLYYGDEIGMIDVPIPPGAVQDPWGRREPGLGLGRDPQRTPMQWSGSLSAGFTDGTPWLPIAAGYPHANVAIEKQDPASILTLYRNLIALRRSSPALTRGSYRAVSLGENVLAYERFEGDQRFLVVLNFDGGPKELTLPSWSGGNVLLSTENRPPAPSSPFLLRPDEGVIIGNATTRIGALHDQ